jgi:phosphatidylglycerol:prolipoprotein diacylglycerol transferase
VKPIFQIGSVELSSYALMLSVGGSVAFWLTFREIQRKRLDPGPMLALTMIAFVAGLIGARGLSVLVRWPAYAEQPWWTFLALWDRGGMAMYGGLLLAATAGLAYIRLRRLPAWDAADTLVAAWVPFIFFLRIGCFLNGCCYGRPTTSAFGIVAGGAPNNVNFGIRSHPAQLYDAAAILAIFALLWWMRSRRRFEGQLAVTFLTLYPAWRLFHETLRGDPWVALRFGRLGVVTLNQLISVALVVYALAAGLVLYAGGALGPDRRRSLSASTPATPIGSE